MDDVLYEARNLAADGVKELIVVAQDTSRYGTDLPGHKRLLAELLRQLCRIDGIHWVRVHYLYPDEIDEELMEVLAEEPKIVKYLDIPIQHIHDGILRRMNRRGDGAYVEALFQKLRESVACTDPDSMERRCNERLHQENLRAFQYLLSSVSWTVCSTLPGVDWQARRLPL